MVLDVITFQTKDFVICVEQPTRLKGLPLGYQKPSALWPLGLLVTLVQAHKAWTTIKNGNIPFDLFLLRISTLTMTLDLTSKSSFL